MGFFATPGFRFRVPGLGFRVPGLGIIHMFGSKVYK